MFSYSRDPAFVDFVLERGNIPFLVRGNLRCEHHFTFDAFGVRIGPPTSDLKVFAENVDSEIFEPIHVTELHQESVFPGEIELKERNRDGIIKALGRLEMWANFICLTMGNPKLKVEVQLPINVIINVSRPKLEYQELERGASLIEAYVQLDASEKDKVSRAMWWYRKACTAQHYSVFDGFSAYWNCLEILCGVSGSLQRSGKEVDRQIEAFFAKLKGKRIRRGHIAQCYNSYVHYSIKQQMQDALTSVLGNSEAQQWIHQCFEVQPQDRQLYRIRNDINHGNIRENSAADLQRVYLRGMVLWHMAMKLLYRKLGRNITLGSTDLNTLADEIYGPFENHDG